ncbi:rhodanese-like domain-containing protein [Kineococcus gynurae]|uniref:Rhodanese-like domain-containing protein n=1 Tax=Kineococcus gynurae TaxID=452979 RepID=A0ABV5LVY3_9ACTN
MTDPSTDAAAGRPTGYAGDLTPREAYDLLTHDPAAVLVDVRTEAEWTFVGVPQLPGRGPLLVSWAPRPGEVPGTEFLAELARQGVRPGPDPVVFLCRSGKRSVAAATAATAAGYTAAQNVLDGFEGDLDASGHRGGAGWRAEGLPWRQS